VFFVPRYVHAFVVGRGWNIHIHDVVSSSVHPLSMTEAAEEETQPQSQPPYQSHLSCSIQPDRQSLCRRYQS